MRFDSPERLAAWTASGGWLFPQIHKGICDLVVSEMRGSRVLDLGCSYGLLGERLLRQAGAMIAVGVDGDGEVVDAGRAAGIAVDLIHMKIEAATLPALYRLIRDRSLDVLVARRILPELFGDDLDLGREFAGEIAAAGIAEVFLEGRVASPKATSALRSVAEEVGLLVGPFREVRRLAALSYLRAV